MKEEIKKVEEATEKWQENVVSKRVAKFKLDESPTRFYTPADLKEDWDFVEDVGFPGQYPFTAGNDALPFWEGLAKMEIKASARMEWGAASAQRYGGFGTPEDYRDYLARMHSMGRFGGPNMALDLPTQCGYDSDDSRARGEVGRVGVAIDSLKDFETIFEPYGGDKDLDSISTNFTINAPAAVLIAMYAVLAEKRGIPLDKLRGTPQNDILKEYVGRGTYIYPPRPSLRLFRDILVFCTEHMPKFNITSGGGYHMREAGCTRTQDLAFSLSIMAAYMQAGIDAGLDIDSFAPRFTFNGFGGSIEIYNEIAFWRAARRMYSRMVRERFGAKNPRSMMIRSIATAHLGCSGTTLQRPINNLTRTVLAGAAGAMSGGPPASFPPYDEPLGLGHSLEAQQLSYDANRIIIHEAKLSQVRDPWAGSYFMESLTDEIEEAAQVEFDKIDKMGGAVAAIESGYMQRGVAQSAYERQKQIENQEYLLVGVNCFDGPHEINVVTERKVPEVYSAELMATAEERKKESLARLKKERNNKEVAKALKKLEETAKDEKKSIMPDVIECVKNYATLQEICDVGRKVFGEYKPPAI